MIAISQNSFLDWKDDFCRDFFYRNEDPRFLTRKTNYQGNNHVSRRFERYSFYLPFRNPLFLGFLRIQVTFEKKYKNETSQMYFRPRDTPTSRKLRPTATRWSGIVSGAKQRRWLRSRVFRYYNFYTTNSACCE